MARTFVLTSLVTAAAAAALLPAPALAQNASPLAGVWTLDRSMSELPREIGFNPSWMTRASQDARGGVSNAGGRGGRGSAPGGRGAAAPFSARPESYEDARRAQLLTDEVRDPPARLTLVDTPGAVTMTNELGQSRTLHPEGKEESIDLQGSPIGVTSTRDGDRLVVLYRVDRDREIRYTYAYAPNPARLVVDVQFLEHGSGDKARRVYRPGTAAGTAAPAAAAPPTSSDKPAPETFDQRPGAELRGLRSLGILVENLSSQAAACGLRKETIESTLSQRLTDGGFTVRRDSDEDTYVYVNIMTSTLSNGMCVSRYDAFLYTHATATLSYRDRPVLVQVSLMHRGGIGSSAPAAHGAAVARGLQDYVDLFVTQIHDANK